MNAPRHPCKISGCSALIEAGQGSYCPAHTTVSRQAARRADRFRGTAHQRGYGSDWQPVRGHFLARYPLCMGVLIPTADYTRELAIEFHELREAERAKGRLLIIPPVRTIVAPLINSAYLSNVQRPTLNAQRPTQTNSLLLDWLSHHPIYRLEPWDVGHGALVVDHIIPHRGADLLRLSEWNFQGLTKRAHDKKTASEDRNAERQMPNAEFSPANAQGSTFIL